MSSEQTNWYAKGIRDGMPIALGYFAVAFSLGIAAKNAGLTPFQAMLASFLNNASAGEFAGFTLIAAGAAYWEMAVMELVANARYLLMSCALSQKLSSKTGLLHRMLIGFDVTDEIFGICIQAPGKLDPRYPYGAMTVAIPGWALGTYFGALMGAILPMRLVSALSVSLYGMFLAIIIPPAKKSRILFGLIVLSMLLSCAAAYLPLFAGMSEGVRIIVLTVALSALAAWLFPIKEAEDEA